MVGAAAVRAAAVLGGVTPPSEKAEQEAAHARSWRARIIWGHAGCVCG